MLSLIRKVEDARSMKYLRPISLINCSFKIISKVLILRLGKVINRLVSPQQSAFIKGRYILESVVTAQELVHCMHSPRALGVILKLDYEKAYDRVSWEFVFEILKSRGFSDVWITWVSHIVMLAGGSVGVNLNGEESSFFKPGKGLRQGDLSLPFFLI